MATPEPTATGRSSLFGSAARVVLVGTFTGVETVTLVVWLLLATDVPALSRAGALAFGVLVAGLVLEHLVTDLTVNWPDTSAPFLPALGISVSEAALWVVWLAIADRVAGAAGFLLAGGVLAVLLVPQHTVEDGILRGEGAFADLFDVRTLGFSVVEAAGATAWLVFVRRPDAVEPLLVDLGLRVVDPTVAGVAVLAIALFVEHSVGVAFSRRG